MNASATRRLGLRRLRSDRSRSRPKKAWAWGLCLSWSQGLKCGSRGKGLSCVQGLQGVVHALIFADLRLQAHSGHKPVKLRLPSFTTGSFLEVQSIADAEFEHAGDSDQAVYAKSDCSAWGLFACELRNFTAIGAGGAQLNITIKKSVLEMIVKEFP